jgi:hypothetical protein
LAAAANQGFHQQPSAAGDAAAAVRLGSDPRHPKSLSLTGRLGWKAVGRGNGAPEGHSKSDEQLRGRQQGKPQRSSW